MNKIYKYMISISKNMYIDKLDDLVNEYNNTYSNTFKIEPANVKSSVHIDSDAKNNDKHPKLEVSYHVRKSKYKNVFSKDYNPNWSEEVFVIKKVKNAVPWTYAISDLNGEKILGTFYEEEMQKTNQTEFRVEKVINIKGDKLYAKWKGYDNLFNTLIDKKDII